MCTLSHYVKHTGPLILKIYIHWSLKIGCCSARFTRGCTRGRNRSWCFSMPMHTEIISACLYFYVFSFFCVALFTCRSYVVFVCQLCDTLICWRDSLRHVATSFAWLGARRMRPCRRYEAHEVMAQHCWENLRMTGEVECVHHGWS